MDGQNPNMSLEQKHAPVDPEETESDESGDELVVVSPQPRRHINLDAIRPPDHDQARCTLCRRPGHLRINCVQYHGCRFCYAGFANIDQLRKHEQFDHHSHTDYNWGVNAKLKKPIEFKCGFCDWRTNAAELLIEHYIELHSTKPSRGLAQQVTAMKFM